MNNALKKKIPSTFPFCVQLWIIDDILFILPCMTKTGKQCIFPFSYKNDTSPVLDYNVCSTLDVFKPWCPTSENVQKH